ncbi:alkaline phosphatase D family protein [Cryptosporangium phraense]|uniref:Alkaline phosphatase n=1 Tax=Cryptosporangium phraense TaxID=2593070 RepID=A0A545AHK2_9ACTN|nr:alkaline phosphatase D family protein [Cryptosporangium phraense]TQS40812.1 alkaline phosphatase [Cryptosporangium phraense]
MSFGHLLPRRGFLATAGAAGLGLLVPRLIDSSPPSHLFTLGVASGDPLPDGVVLWTRLAPRPLDGGGMPDRPVPVRWEVATDENFATVVRSGTATATPALAHSVHVDVRGLRPGAEYFYRFRVGGQASPVGRTRTAPAAGTLPRALRFAVASCQSWADGYYTAYRGLVDEDVEFVAFLGDYIYESPPRDDTVRKHEGSGEPWSLVEYRNRHAQYRTDPLLAEAHAAVPWIVTWDDHEVVDDWAGGPSGDARFRGRRAAAFQAYYEHLPVRTRPPLGLGLQVYRRLTYGQLATFHVLDTRQYRSPAPSTLEEAEDPARTMTGTAQEQWLLDGLARSGTRWNLLLNQVMWASNDRTAGPRESYDFDNWDGYRVQRRRLLERMTPNTVVLTGDRHATFVCDLTTEHAVVGAEITGTSISSGGDADQSAFHRTFDPIMAESPHWKYIDNQRGYVLCEVGPEALRSGLRVVDTVRDPNGGTMRTAARFVVESGRPGIAVDGARPPARRRPRWT